VGGDCVPVGGSHVPILRALQLPSGGYWQAEYDDDDSRRLFFWSSRTKRVSGDGSHSTPQRHSATPLTPTESTILLRGGMSRRRRRRQSASTVAPKIDQPETDHWSFFVPRPIQLTIHSSGHTPPPFRLVRLHSTPPPLFGRHPASVLLRHLSDQLSNLSLFSRADQNLPCSYRTLALTWHLSQSVTVPASDLTILYLNNLLLPQKCWAVVIALRLGLHGG
jgi:hypothetical protein